MKFKELTEGMRFRSSDEMLRYVLDQLNMSIKDFKQDPDQDAYYVVQDVERILDEIGSSRIVKNFTG